MAESDPPLASMGRLAAHEGCVAGVGFQGAFLVGMV